MPPDFSDPKVVKQHELKAKAEQEVLDTTLVQIMNTTSGRKFIWGKLNDAHIFNLSFSPGLTPVEMAFNEGQRSPGLKLYLELMRACPDQYVQMWREANARDVAAADESAGDKDRDGRDQGPDERQLDFYRDLASGTISVDFGSDEAA